MKLLIFINIIKQVLYLGHVIIFVRLRRNDEIVAVSVVFAAYSLTTQKQPPEVFYKKSFS